MYLLFVRASILFSLVLDVLVFGGRDRLSFLGEPHEPGTRFEYTDWWEMIRSMRRHYVMKMWIEMDIEMDFDIILTFFRNKRIGGGRIYLGCAGMSYWCNFNDFSPKENIWKN